MNNKKSWIALLSMAAICLIAITIGVITENKEKDTVTEEPTSSVKEGNYDEINEIKPPYDNDTSDGVNYKDVVNAFKNAGFTSITTEKRFSSEVWGNEENTVANIYINGHSFDMDDTYPPDSEIRIDYYVTTESDSKSDIKLTKFYAQKAFEEYGELRYPYGFQCHWLANLINAEQSDDGSWYFKVGVTITNAYGNELETIAEGTVSGTDKNPKVDQFYVNE